ncbi:putative MFS monocarboxylate transporter [Zopfia rhizophila CBS 207.26]|uniref:Putative MFS monocarboxylate transporter n=1 Tax=Zopfia rhizophila CBS 207.26 TaxID=1314779 RepID=A0A6A6E0C4_9PEZI|nr:putative MFS monocarboxylate transporter [Zopfia rhizophila CBS 207.26]
MATAVIEPEVSRQAEEQESQHSMIAAERDHEKAIPDAPEFGPAPEGDSAIFFCTLDSISTIDYRRQHCSFGTLEGYYLTHQMQGESASKISWIGSLAVFLQFFAGMVGRPLFDRFGAKVVQPAAIAYVFAMMILSPCKTYWQVMLVQCVLMGIVMCLLQLPAFAAVSQYFDKNWAGAMGLVVSGSSIGGVIIPIVLSKMLNDSSLGFGWSARLPPRETQFWLISTYKEERFVILIIALFFMFFGMFTPFFYLPTYAITQGIGPTLTGYQLSIVNTASTFGRIVPSVLADKYGHLNIVTSNAGLIVYSVFFGFASGTIMSGASAAFSLCPQDARNAGTYMGMGVAIAGLGGLIGPPLNGAIVNTCGGYFQVSMFSGAMCLFGGFVTLLAKLSTPQGLLGRT